LITFGADVRDFGSDGGGVLGTPAGDCTADEDGAADGDGAAGAAGADGGAGAASFVSFGADVFDDDAFGADAFGADAFGADAFSAFFSNLFCFCSQRTS